MKPSHIIVAVFSFSFFSVHSQVNADEAAIEEVILEAYVNGFLNDGIERNIKLGYSTEYKSVGMTEEGQTLVQTYTDLLAGVQQKKADGEYPLRDPDRIRVKYLRLDVVGAAATVKLELRQGKDLLYTDMLGLYKFPGGWLIVNRIYDQRKQEDQKL